ncbi:unnamed protein product [Vitrella brassicaformis CCMP3155]|uniref:Uncharacterized protein n=1 Tax=Vitrella brassicaformis (strain CCMP3155) TaxID=1169540 RepID=A0A0G4EFU4_VITBC|nr:unnamed protein product [Vitrella brassicaformis CCMP3155]|eukprot:CEL94250.1 unnamed protein product [Vitrella brassicaformis CCMP3155]
MSTGCCAFPADDSVHDDYQDYHASDADVEDLTGEDDDDDPMDIDDPSHPHSASASAGASTSTAHQLFAAQSTPLPWGALHQPGFSYKQAGDVILDDWTLKGFDGTERECKARHTVLRQQFDASGGCDIITVADDCTVEWHNRGWKKETDLDQARANDAVATSCGALAHMAKNICREVWHLPRRCKNRGWMSFKIGGKVVTAKEDCYQRFVCTRVRAAKQLAAHGMGDKQAYMRTMSRRGNHNYQRLVHTKDVLPFCTIADGEYSGRALTSKEKKCRRYRDYNRCENVGEANMIGLAHPSGSADASWLVTAPLHVMTVVVVRHADNAPQYADRHHFHHNTELT